MHLFVCVTDVNPGYFYIIIVVMQKLYIIRISIISLVSTWWHSKVDPTDCFTDGKQRYGFICDNVFEFVFVFVYLTQRLLASTWWRRKADPTDCFTEGDQKHFYITICCQVGIFRLRLRL